MKSTNTHIELLITKALTGSISILEKQELDGWLDASEENRYEYKQWQVAWDKSENLKAFYEEDVASAWKECCVKRQFSKLPRNSFLFRKIAAVLIPAMLMLGGTYLYHNIPGFGKLLSMQAEDGKAAITLADQSVVTLDAGSQLIYSRSIKGDSRTVELKGQGYFDVTRDETKPFVVTVGATQIEVLGTEFNIYQNQEEDEVILYVTEGCVQFSVEDKELTLVADDMAVYKAGKMEMINGSKINALSWKEGQLVFRQSDFKTVLNDVRNHFSDIKSVKIKCDKPDNKITTSFTEPTLDEVLFELAIHFDKKFTMDDDILIISD